MGLMLSEARCFAPIGGGCIPLKLQTDRQIEQGNFSNEVTLVPYG
jgi:hypothetical protein